MTTEIGRKLAATAGCTDPACVPLLSEKAGSSRAGNWLLEGSLQSLGSLSLAPPLLSLFHECLKKDSGQALYQGLAKISLQDHGPWAGLVSCVGCQKTKEIDQQGSFSSKKERSPDEALKMGIAREGINKGLTDELTTTHNTQQNVY